MSLLHCAPGTPFDLRFEVESPDEVSIRTLYRQPGQAWTDVGESRDRASVPRSVHVFHVPGLVSQSAVMSQALIAGNPNSPYRVQVVFLQGGAEVDRLPPLQGRTNDSGVAGGRIEATVP